MSIDEKEMVREYEAGVYVRVLARKYNLSPEDVMGRLKNAPMPPRIAKITYDNKVRIETKLARGKRESPREHRERCEIEVAEEWKSGVSTLRAFKNLRRRPRLDHHQKFFDDLRRYGRARFRDDGTVVESSLGTGPLPPEFFAVTPAGTDSINRGRVTATDIEAAASP